jgi:hypothetical protein
MTHLLVFIFTFSILNLIRSGFSFYRGLVEENPEPVNLGVGELILLGVSISIIITCLFCGFTL